MSYELLVMSLIELSTFSWGENLRVILTAHSSLST